MKRYSCSVLRLVAVCLLCAGIAFGGQITRPDKNVRDLPNWDTLSTACLSLVVQNDGSAGNEGVGLVNMDWVANGDCDSTADVYLYSSSPVIGWIDGVDTIMNWSVYNAWSGSPVGFVPLTAGQIETTADYTSYSSLFTTQDSSIALKQTWYAPTSVDSCAFIIKELQVYNYDDADGPITGVVIGEVVDWDIPSDSGLENGSGFDASRNLIYQYGAEYGDPGCVDNDLRYGGIAFLQMLTRTNTVDDAGNFYGAYTENNATYVYGNTYGLVMSEIYENMTNPYIGGGGFALWSSDDPDSAFTDLHTGMSFVNDYTVTPGETLVVYTALATVEKGGLAGIESAIDAAEKWYCGNLALYDCGCCWRRGDVDDIVAVGSVDVSDLTYLVAYLFKGGPEPPCMEQANVDAIAGPSGPIDVNDLTYLVVYLFRGGPAPPPC